MLPGESLRPCRIGMMVTSTGAQNARCRSGRSLRGHAATPDPKPCGHAPKPSGRSDAPSAVAFTSAAVDDVGSEQLHIKSPEGKNRYLATRPHFLENSYGD